MGEQKLENLKVSVDKLFKAKKERRQILAQLPIEEKIKILVKLQEMASPILTQRGINKYPWKINIS